MRTVTVDGLRLVNLAAGLDLVPGLLLGRGLGMEGVEIVVPVVMVGDDDDCVEGGSVVAVGWVDGGRVGMLMDDGRGDGDDVDAL